MNIPFSPMDVIDNTHGNKALSGRVRILGWHHPKPTAHKDNDIGSEYGVWVIDLPRNSKRKETQRKGYYDGPYREPLSKLTQMVADSAIYVLKLTPDVKLSMSDADRLAACTKERQRKQLEKAFADRNNRYDAILPLLRALGTTALLPLSALLEDELLGSRIAARAKELGRPVSTLYNWLHRYMAGGCQKNALLSNYDHCGGPGKPKPQNTKLGRTSRLYKRGLIPSRGYSLDDEDKQKLAWGYRLINHSMRPRDAYLLTCATHWAEHSNDKRGEVQPLLFEIHLRPSFEQFKRWGRKLNNTTVTQMLLGPVKWSQRTESKGGSEQDSVVAIGQGSLFDGTSSDLYLTTYRSRLKKLPPMTRLVLKEGRCGVIYGIYCGWEAPSAQTALQAIRHGAMPSKVEWAARFGVTIPEGAIPGLLARHHLADNGELKGEKQSEAELQFGFGLDVAPAMSGHKKGGIETQHHSDHAYLDHRLPGSTHGKRRERGQDHAAQQAMFNYYEYMAELIHQIVWHNTVQEVPHLAPDDMLLADPPIKATRMNIYRWLCDQRMDVSIPVDYQTFSAFTLPEVGAVIRKNGIYLEAKILGRKMLLPRLRYTSPELVATGLLSQVKQTGSPLHVHVKMDQSDLSQAWLPTKAGLIRVATSPRDKTILTKLTLTEWISYWEEFIIRSDLAKGEKDQFDTDTVLRRLAVTAMAESDADAEIEARGKRPSKAELVRNLDKNRSEELAFLKAQELAYSKAERPVAQKDDHVDSNQTEETAADAAMDAFFTQREHA